MVVEAEVWLPEEVTIDYKQQQLLVHELETELDRGVDLRLRLQTTLSIVSEQSLFNRTVESRIRKAVVAAIANAERSFVVDSVQTHFNEGTTDWEVTVVVKGDPATVFSHQERRVLESSIEEDTSEAIELTLEIIPRITLQSEPDILEAQITQYFEERVAEISPEIDVYITSLSGLEALPTDTEAPDPVIMTVDLRVPSTQSITDVQMVAVKDDLERVFGREFFFNVSTLSKEVLTY